MKSASALIADDEPLLRERLRSHLAVLWPALTVIADARNGAEALELFELHQPDIVFLDIRMPGLDGIATARALARRAQLVFVTAYDQYALQAFEQGAIDYLVKPVDPARLADTVQRLQRQLAGPSREAQGLDAVLGSWPAGWASAPRRPPGCSGSRRPSAAACASFPSSKCAICGPRKNTRWWRGTRARP